MIHLTSSATSAVQALQHAFKLVDDLKSQPERELAYHVVVSHVRSANPVALLGAAPVPLEPEQDALIDLGEGRLVRLRVLDGRLNMYVCEAAGQHDVNVVIGELARVQLVAALGAVR